ncbi:MAG: HK97 gp10 family phage protein, partial [Chloroflexota bacterium]|nr:HK97 gp10 family phage protein [Chloroflexota bacterium]
GRAREGMLGFAAAVGALSQSGRELGRSGGIQLRFRTNAHQVADQIDALEAEIEDAARRTMEKAVLMVQAEAQRRAPVDTGTLRRSITGQVRPLGAQPAGSLSARKVGNAFPGQKVGTVGVVGTKLNYARAVEFGRRPGKRPPTARLRGWARRRTGSADNAYPVARAIGRRGTRPQPFLEPALEARRAEIQRMFERELSAVVRKFQ